MQALPSKKARRPLTRRISDHCWLQDHGFRTFGMLCPILPCDDVDDVVGRLAAMVRVERCEEVWAEVINLRGDSMRPERRMRY